MDKKLYLVLIAGCLLTIGGSLLAVTQTPKMEASITASQSDTYVLHPSIDNSGSGIVSSSVAHQSSGRPIPSQASSQAVINNSIERSLTTKNADHAYFQDVAFIGDSRTQGLMTCSDLSDATFLAVKGLTVRTVFTEAAIQTKNGNQTVMDTLKSSKFGKVYIMLGINELGWAYSDVFVEEYGKVIDAVRKSQPSAKIIVQAIFPVTEKRSDSDKIFNNTNIAKYNQLIQKMAQEKKIIYLDVSPALTDGSGNLSPDASTDGIHLNHAYCQKWSDFIRAHKE